MTEAQELRDNAWVAFWMERPYALKDERFRQAFFAGYDARRAQEAAEVRDWHEEEAERYNKTHPNVDIG